MSGSAESGRSVVSRVTAILMTFRSGGTHSLSELAGLAGLPVSTTHRLVGELVSRRVLERTDAGSYRVGLPLRMIGAASVHRPPPLLERGLEMINDLSEVTQTTVRIGVLSGARLAVAEAGPGRPPRGYLAEEAVPVYRSALGRALLAFSPPSVVDEVLAQASCEDDGGQGDADQLRRILATTRLARISVRRDEDGSACALAVPVFGPGGVVMAAMEAAAVDVRAGYEPVRSALLVAAGSLSRDLATALLSTPGSEASPGDLVEDPECATGW